MSGLDARDSADPVRTPSFRPGCAGRGMILTVYLRGHDCWSGQRIIVLRVLFQMSKGKLQVVLLCLLLLSVSGFTECYKPVGRGENLPSHIKTLAIPAFQNPSRRFKIEQRFTAAMIDEALRRARALKIVSTAEGADAVMLGTIKSYAWRGTVLDEFGRARIFEMTITASITVRDQTKNKVIFDNQNYVYRGEYEVSGDPQTFFSEEGPALNRIARDFAKSVLTTILEGF